MHVATSLLARCCLRLAGTSFCPLPVVGVLPIHFFTDDPLALLALCTLVGAQVDFSTMPVYNRLCLRHSLLRDARGRR